ncbi:MAG TPA: alpha/beta hydrolase [Candidatus Manganitrophaceae bacterium]|nr:alpha/beta hydrolase [Candidatus Manganitrophaceae bacterium]
MEEKIVLEPVPSEKTSVVVAAPERPTDRIVLLCHGFMSSKESSTNRRLTDRLLPLNIATLRFDLFGHGESDGPFEKLTLSRCLAQAEGLVQWCGKNGYTRLGLVGSSFGGLVAVHLAAGHPELLAVGLKCPVSDYPPIWRQRLGEAGIEFWKQSGLLSFATPEGKARLEYAFYEDLLKYDSYRDAGKIRSPALIIHGEADEYVPFDQSRHLFETLPSRKEMEGVPGADHAFSNPADFEKMVNRITGWMADHL